MNNKHLLFLCLMTIATPLILATTDTSLDSAQKPESTYSTETLNSVEQQPAALMSPPRKPSSKSPARTNSLLQTPPSGRGQAVPHSPSGRRVSFPDLSGTIEKQPNESLIKNYQRKQTLVSPFHTTHQVKVSPAHPRRQDNQLRRQDITVQKSVHRITFDADVKDELEDDLEAYHQGSKYAFAQRYVRMHDRVIDRFATNLVDYIREDRSNRVPGSHVTPDRRTLNHALTIDILYDVIRKGTPVLSYNRNDRVWVLEIIAFAPSTDYLNMRSATRDPYRYISLTFGAKRGAPQAWKGNRRTPGTPYWCYHFCSQGNINLFGPDRYLADVTAKIDFNETENGSNGMLYFEVDFNTTFKPGLPHNERIMHAILNKPTLHKSPFLRRSFGVTPGSRTLNLST